MTSKINAKMASKLPLKHPIAETKGFVIVFSASESCDET